MDPCHCILHSTICNNWYQSKGNLQKACSMAASYGQSMPCASLCRALPKGAVGLQHVKELHDDGNAAVIPGVWTSVIGNETVSLKFLGRGMNYSLAATDLRFCWFYGWIPHKTEVRADCSFHASGVMTELQ